MFRLSEQGQEEVKTKPEFGMGFQIVESNIRGDDEIFFIFNSRYAVSLDDVMSTDEPTPDEIYEQTPEGRFDLQDMLVQWYGEAEEARFVDSIQDYFGLYNPRSDRVIWGREWPFPPFIVPRKPFSPIPRLAQSTRNFDGFVRVSREPDDKRINDDGSVEPETYATSPLDFEHAPSGFSSVGRYALPYKSAAVYAYTIVPDRSVNEPVIGGTVQPSFGQAGGGVEVMFPNGLPPGSAHPEPYIIPTI